MQCLEGVWRAHNKEMDVLIAELSERRDRDLDGELHVRHGVRARCNKGRWDRNDQLQLSPGHDRWNARGWKGGEIILKLPGKKTPDWPFNPFGDPKSTNPFGRWPSITVVVLAV